MTIEEFKVVWTGFRGPIDGTLRRSNAHYAVAWDDGVTASGAICDLPESWVAAITVVAKLADIKVPIPAGWTATGEFRSPVPLTDCYLHQDGVTVIEAKRGN